jgi:hypothetical protein
MTCYNALSSNPSTAKKEKKKWSLISSPLNVDLLQTESRSDSTALFIRFVYFAVLAIEPRAFEANARSTT